MTDETDTYWKRLSDAHDRVEALEAEVERMRIGWDADVDWANKLLAERDAARAQLAETEKNRDKWRERARELAEAGVRLLTGKAER